MKDNAKHTSIHTNKANMEWWLRRPNDIRGPCGPKSFPTFVLQVRKNPEKNTQETCPDRESNPGPLRDKRACYHLLHRDGHLFYYIWKTCLVVKTLGYLLVATSFSKNFAIFRPSSVVDHTGVHVKFELYTNIKRNNIYTNMILQLRLAWRWQNSCWN